VATDDRDRLFTEATRACLAAGLIDWRRSGELHGVAQSLLDLKRASLADGILG
jgi:hypothetical protein